MINVIEIIIVLLIIELNFIEMIITASHCYDVNYKFLYLENYKMTFLFPNYR